MQKGTWHSSQEKESTMVLGIRKRRTQQCKVLKICTVAKRIDMVMLRSCQKRRKKLKQVQISEELFFTLIKYHLLEMEEVSPKIKKGLEAKLEAMVKRELYTKYKTAPTEEEQEKAGQEYLNKVGMHSDFQW